MSILFGEAHVLFTFEVLFFQKAQRLERNYFFLVKIKYLFSGEIVYSYMMEKPFPDHCVLIEKNLLKIEFQYLK